MNKMFNKGDMRGYRGYLVPKNWIPGEAILYLLACQFLSLLVFIVLFFINVDAVIALSMSVAFAIGTFIALWKLNNILFAKDNGIINNLLVTDKIDTIDLLGRFYRDLRKQFEASSKNYFGVSTLSEMQDVDLISLFSTVFREHGEHLLCQFMVQNGCFLVFIESLNASQREVLYRWYLWRGEGEKSLNGRQPG